MINLKCNGTIIGQYDNQRDCLFNILYFAMSNTKNVYIDFKNNVAHFDGLKCTIEEVS